MKRWPLVLLAGTASLAGSASADPPAGTSPAPKACQVPDNRITGPRMPDRPLPLLSGDAAHGFRAACAVPWKTLSPDGDSLAVVGCYQDNLLQVANDAACGQGTGRLWVSIRWVATSADKPAAPDDSATCQRLETGTYAATRDFPTTPCVPPGTAARADATTQGAAGEKPAAAAAPAPPQAATPRPDH